MRKLLLAFSLTFFAGSAWAGSGPKPQPAASVDSAALYQAYVDSVHATLRYASAGRVVLPGGLAEMTVPRGFRYLDSAQSRRVLTQLWSNPDGACLGMLFPADRGPLDEGDWAYVIEYDPSGHVKDDDAADLDYDELLEEMQKDTEEGNAEREAAGYKPVHLDGWAAKPYYDANEHTLHWAKLLRFGSGSADATLNYNVRLLGRKGVLVLNAVGAPEQLAEIKATIPGLLASVSFAKGQQYTDFDAGLDEVAAYGIGGLVAGKVLAKVGFFALVVKFWKVLAFGLAAAWAAVKRFFGFGNKEA